MREVIQSNETNPALISPYKFVLALPSFNSGYYNSAFSVNDFGTVEGDVLTLAPEKALESMSDLRNLVQGNANFSIGSISFKFKDLQFKIFHNSNIDLYTSYPKSLMELLWYGNGAFIGEEIEIAPQIDFTVFHEYGVGFAFQVNENLSLGTNLKYLNGILSFRTERSQASLFTSEEFYQLSAKTDLMFYSSGFSDFLNGADGDLVLYNNTGSYILNQNSGFAIDVGFHSKVSERFSVAVSALDLGFINWRESTYEQYSQGEFEFEGVEIKAFNENDDYDFENVLDSIDNLVDFESAIMNGGYKTSLSPRFYLSGNWNLSETFTLGALAFGELHRGELYPALALNAQKNFRHFFGIGGLVGLRENYSVNVGLNMFLRLGGIQIYGVTDNVLSIFDFNSGQSANFRVGMNLAFLGKKKEEIEENAIELAKEEIMDEEDVSPSNKPLTKKEIRQQKRAARKKKAKPDEGTKKKKEYFRRTDNY